MFNTTYISSDDDSCTSSEMMNNILDDFHRKNTNQPKEQTRLSTSPHTSVNSSKKGMSVGNFDTGGQSLLDNSRESVL